MGTVRTLFALLLAVTGTWALTQSPLYGAQAWGPALGGVSDAPVLAARLGEQQQRLQIVEDPEPGALSGFQEAPDGTRYLLIRYRAESANALRLRFDAFHLPEGARVFVYAPDAAPAKVFGPFSGAGPMASGEFLSPAMEGSVAVVELQVDGEVPADLPFHVAGIETADTADNGPEGQVNLEESFPSEPGEFRYSMYRGMAVLHEVRNGMAILEGDILLGPADELEPVTATNGKDRTRQSIGILGSRYRWPGGVIPYVIDPALPSNYRVTDAVSHWNAVMAGVVKFVPRTSQTNYVNFRWTSSASTCSSSVGMLGYGGQVVWVGNYCSTGNMIHEMGHAVGLWHEQSRADRDRYVSIQWANIGTAYTYNFYQNISNGFDIGLYDYGSVMHYPAWGFSINGLPTIITIPAGIPIGQRNGLSTGDIAGVKTLYSGLTTPTTPTTTTATTTVSTNPSDSVVSVDGLSFSGSRAFAWQPGTLHTVSAPASFSTASTRYVFSRWSDGGAATHTITAASAATALTAFYSKEHKVTASTTTSGTVMLSPASPTGYYADSTTVLLGATPAPGSCFAGWSGLLAGTPAQTALSVTKPYAVQAVFATGALTVTPASISLDWKSYSGSISVASSSGCSWSVKSTATWLGVRGSTTFTGSAAITFTADANNTGAARTAAILVGDRPVWVTQAPKR